MNDNEGEDQTGWERWPSDCVTRGKGRGRQVSDVVWRRQRRAPVPTFLVWTFAVASPTNRRWPRAPAPHCSSLFTVTVENCNDTKGNITLAHFLALAYTTACNPWCNKLQLGRTEWEPTRVGARFLVLTRQVAPLSISSCIFIVGCRNGNVAGIQLNKKDKVRPKQPKQKGCSLIVLDYACLSFISEKSEYHEFTST